MRHKRVLVHTHLHQRQDNIALRDSLARVPKQHRPDIATGADADAQPQFESNIAIAGTITIVDDSAGGQLVQVDVGSKDGVEENMKFMVITFIKQ